MTAAQRFLPIATVLALATALLTVMPASVGVASAQPGGVVLTAAGMDNDEQTAVAAVDGYWKRHFTEFFNKPYTSPHVRGAYTGTNGPTCGASRAQPMNAYYCPAGDYLAWDENLMSAGYKRVGNAWVYLIIAHEWGHAIQARMRRGQVSVADELQADCLAGAELSGAVRDGVIQMEPGDSQALADTLRVLADDTPWTSRSDHGDAQQRIAAYNKGAQGGVRACI
jgi:uncharacterized protein